MGELTATEANRIMAHMNGDHADSLVHYVQHFGRTKTVGKPIKMTKFTAEEMVITYGKARKSYVYKFNPPMLAGAARTRLEKMHTDAREALGLSAITVNSINLGQSTSIVLAAGTLLQLLLIFAPSAMIVNNMPWMATKAIALLRYLNLASSEFTIATAVKLLLVVPLQTAHLGEAIFFLMPLMRKYNMTSARVRAFYFIATIFGGLPVWSQLKQSGESQEFTLKAKSK